MSKTLNITVDAKVYDPNNSSFSVEDEVSTRLDLGLQADNHGQAMVLGLRKAAQATAARLGIHGEQEAPPAVTRVIGELATLADQATGNCVLRPEQLMGWARRLAGEYGLVLAGDVAGMASNAVGCGEA